MTGEKQRILFFSGETRGKKVNSVEVALDDPALDEMLGGRRRPPPCGRR